MAAQYIIFLMEILYKFSSGMIADESAIYNIHWDKISG